MMEESGCLFAAVGLALVLWCICAMASDWGRDRAHEEFVACRAASAQAKSDSTAAALRPECKRWLFPESAK